MKTVCVKCKKCGKTKYITEKYGGAFNNPITFVCNMCHSVYSNIKVEEIFDHNIGEVPTSTPGFALGKWALLLLVGGIVWCFINLKAGLITIGVAVLLYILSMVIGYRSINR